MIFIRSENEINKISYASNIVAEILTLLRDIIKEGTTTKEIEIFVERYIRKKGCKPAFKGYRGFPGALCTSINNEVVHGIPSKKRILKEGDIISIDLGVVYKGYIGDSARTYAVGNIGEDVKHLLTITEESLYKGIEVAIENHRVSDISHAVQSYVESNGYSVVRDFVGHGVGRDLHEEPQIPNYGAPNRGPRLKKGMVLAIEPMVNAGKHEVKVLKDGWTAVTLDGSYSAHFEHTIVVGNSTPRILTLIKE